METNKYIQIDDFYAGMRIDSVLDKLKNKSNETGELYSTKFNSSVIYSTDTIDEAYKRITGKTKTECDLEAEKQREEYKRKQEEHNAKIPQLTIEWIEKGKKVLDTKYHELWEKCVPIRLGDLYRGMELECCLDLIKSIDNFDNAKKLFYKQGHSGMSAGLVFSMLKAFSDRGQELVDYLEK